MKMKQKKNLVCIELFFTTIHYFYRELIILLDYCIMISLTFKYCMRISKKVIKRAENTL